MGDLLILGELHVYFIDQLDFSLGHLVLDLSYSLSNVLSLEEPASNSTWIAVFSVVRPLSLRSILSLVAFTLAACLVLMAYE
jgi:hypothetical protein